MTDITDDVLRVLVGAREAGVSRQECHELVRDVYAALWDSQAVPTPVGFARRLVEKIFRTPRIDGLDLHHHQPAAAERRWRRGVSASCGKVGV